MDISLNFFMENCVVDKNPKTGILDKIFLHTYQKELVEKIIANNLTYVLTSRQMGVGLSLAAYTSHQLISNKGFHIIHISPSTETRNKFLSTVKNILGSIYSSGIKSSINSIKLENGGKITGVVSSKNACRGEVADVVIFENATHIQCFSDIWISALPCLSMKGANKIILTSDSKFTDETLFSIFKKSNPITLHWSLNPHYTEERIKEIRKIVGPEIFKYEYDLVIPEEIFKIEQKDNTVNARLEKSLYEKVLKHSAENNISISELIRTLLQEKCG